MSNRPPGTGRGDPQCFVEPRTSFETRSRSSKRPSSVLSKTRVVPGTNVGYPFLGDENLAANDRVRTSQKWHSSLSRWKVKYLPSSLNRESLGCPMVVTTNSSSLRVTFQTTYLRSGRRTKHRSPSELN